jgi:hypothetical protein
VVEKELIIPWLPALRFRARDVNLLLFKEAVDVVFHTRCARGTATVKTFNRGSGTRKAYNAFSHDCQLEK